jgi:hypothetical protein
MKINSDLGYEPVTYSELTTDEQFWNGCKSCVNYEILQSKEKKNCLCTAMLYDPVKEQKQKRRWKEWKIMERFNAIKIVQLLKSFPPKKNKHEKSNISI